MPIHNRTEWANIEGLSIQENMALNLVYGQKYKYPDAAYLMEVDTKKVDNLIQSAKRKKIKDGSLTKKPYLKRFFKDLCKHTGLKDALIPCLPLYAFMNRDPLNKASRKKLAGLGTKYNCDYAFHYALRADKGKMLAVNGEAIPLLQDPLRYIKNRISLHRMMKIFWLIGVRAMPKQKPFDEENWKPEFSYNQYNDKFDDKELFEVFGKIDRGTGEKPGQTLIDNGLESIGSRGESDPFKLTIEQGSFIEASLALKYKEPEKTDTRKGQSSRGLLCDLCHRDVGSAKCKECTPYIQQGLYKFLKFFRTTSCGTDGYSLLLINNEVGKRSQVCQGFLVNNITQADDILKRFDKDNLFIERRYLDNSSNGPESFCFLCIHGLPKEQCGTCAKLKSLDLGREYDLMPRNYPEDRIDFSKYKDEYTEHGFFVKTPID